MATGRGREDLLRSLLAVACPFAFANTNVISSSSSRTGSHSFIRALLLRSDSRFGMFQALFDFDLIEFGALLRFEPEADFPARLLDLKRT